MLSNLHSFVIKSSKNRQLLTPASATNMTTKEINSIKISDYLKTIGINPVKEKISTGLFNSPFREDKNPSFKVDYQKNQWYDFSSGFGGSLIDLIMKIHQCNCSEAIRFAETVLAVKCHVTPSFSFQGRPSYTHTQTIVISEVGKLNHPSLLQYLQYRAIDLTIATQYLSEVHYSIGDKKYFGIGFENDLHGYEIRNKYFKGGCSPKSITTIDNNHPSCFVFEGFMDYLTYLTLNSIPKPEENVLVLNSVIHLSKAADFLKRHTAVHCYLDNDNAGVNALDRIKEMGIIEVVDHSSEYHPYKDLNEYLMANSKIT